MNTLKTPSFFKPTSRPSSPAPASPRPDSAAGFERSRPLTKLSLSNFRRPSPAPTTSSSLGAPLVQDGSYLEMLGLKLSEAVSKALAQPIGPVPSTEQLAGKRAVPAGRGHALGALIASELKAATGNPHLYRAIIRSLHRPLSVLQSNLSSLLLPLISSVAFLTPAAPIISAPNPNPTQIHALAISTFAGELLETFEQFNLGVDAADGRGDGLRSVREGLVSIVQRVINPLVAGIKHELMPLIEALESPHGIKWGRVHPSISTMQSVLPVYVRALTRYSSSSTSQTILASFLISVVWRSMVALSNRPFAPSSPPASPGLVPNKKRRSSPSSTPPLTPPAARFNIKLPVSRPPSPPNVVDPCQVATDARALYELLNMLPRPSADSAGTRLAREAVEEAFHGLEALPNLFNSAYALPSRASGEYSAETLAQELQTHTAELPTLLALPILIQVYGSTSTVASILGLSEDDYRSGCLSGFGRADSCAAAVGQRVLDHLLLDHPRSDNLGLAITRWLDGEIEEAG
ncbi:hypothetical protein C8J56DRAFT_448663 [Mycena floridula]|nr:hypothetical protein C8J56DRAFT_448663 [Mycena floridula]